MGRNGWKTDTRRTRLDCFSHHADHDCSQQKAELPIARRALVSCDVPSLLLVLESHRIQYLPRPLVTLTVGQLPTVIRLLPKLLWSVLHHATDGMKLTVRTRPTHS
jgi:hypothetical protein